MNDKAILNYPGSKKRLLDFIYDNTKNYIKKDKYILDIFSGTGCVSQMYKSHNYNVFANDVEIYASNISSTLLKNSHKINISNIEENYRSNFEQLLLLYSKDISDENEYILNKDLKIIDFNNNLRKIWKDNFKMTINSISIHSINDLNTNINKIPFMLFTLYYSGIYFGIKQSMDIDSIRFAIEKEDNKDVLFTCLYYAMKEASFSKDGHMAQPLNQNKNLKKLFDVRDKNIHELFINKLQEFMKINEETNEGHSFNLSFIDLINNDEITKKVGFIYADPPYTDMQYSRYFHLLTTISNYEYPEMTYKYKKLTSGLYANNRYQSSISSKSKSLNELKKLMDFSSKNNINLCFSYAYPVDTENQPTNRYTMKIKDLIGEMNKRFDKVDIIKENYHHCNNRNSQQKKVYEYLIIGSNDEQEIKEDNAIVNFKNRINEVTATNKSPLYDNMLYWAQKPFNITNLILDMFAKDGNTILDPFMGSGVTLIESLNKKYSLKSVGIDINDVPIFLCKNSLNIVNKSDIDYLNDLKKKILLLCVEYTTKCSVCGEVAVIKKIIYDTDPSFAIKDIIYNCKCSKKDLHKKAETSDIDNFNKKRHIKNITNIKLIENSRIAVKNNEKISDKFSYRSLYVLDYIKGLIDEISNLNVKEISNFILTSIIHKSKILDVKMSSQWPLWVPKNNCIERNVPMLFADSIDKYLESIDFIANNYYTNSFVNEYNELDKNKSLIIKKGTQYVTNSIIPDSSIDLVITDPPYLGQVPYSEYMQLYQAFLKNDIDYENEIVITNAKGRNKDYDNYMHLMDDAFRNVSRMLKNNGYMFLYFHDSSLSVWNDLIKMFNKNNLIFQTSIHISKSKKTLKKILDPKKTMNGESLIIFKKERNHPYYNNKNLDYIRDINEICKHIFKNKKYVSTSELYDNGILEYIINNNIIDMLSKKYKDLTEIFGIVLKWNEEIGLWSQKNE